jgi:hypothetical protein
MSWTPPARERGLRTYEASPNRGCVRGPESTLRFARENAPHLNDTRPQVTIENIEEHSDAIAALSAVANDHEIPLRDVGPLLDLLWQVQRIQEIERGRPLSFAEHARPISSAGTVGRAEAGLSVGDGCHCGRPLSRMMPRLRATLPRRFGDGAHRSSPGVLIEVTAR